MKIFITGATGFVGGRVLEELLQRGHQVVALVRRAESLQGVEEIVGDAARREWTSSEALRGCQAAIHLVGIIREIPQRGATFSLAHVEATRNVLIACRNTEIPRVIHMSSLGADLNSRARFQRTKAQAEELVRSSGLRWTILRPAPILGHNGEFFRMMRGMVARRIVPIVGRGKNIMAPVSVSTVAQAFAGALDKAASIGKIYELGGEAVQYQKMMRILGEVIGRRPMFIKLPVFLVRQLAAAFERFSFFPITREQIIMMGEAKAPADNSIYQDLDLPFQNAQEVMREALVG